MPLGTRCFSSFSEFWPFYVGAHQEPFCRVLHYIGGGGALAIAGYAVTVGPLWCLLLVPVVGYSFAWIAHFAFERNEPATFRYPIYSILAEFKMLWLGVTGRMRAEVDRFYGVPSATSDAVPPVGHDGK